MSNKQSTNPLKADKGPNDEGHRHRFMGFDKKMEKEKIKFLNVKYTDKESAESRNYRERAIDQALTLIENFYVHLPPKKTKYAVDPLRRLRLLRDRNFGQANGKPDLNNREFFNEMTSIFTELRDFHTTFVLPYPYKDQVVFLPFLIEEFYEEDEEDKEKKKVKKYMVSKIYDDELKDPKYSFKRGVVITHWNGIPIEKAVALNGERNAGSNECARQARGLERMTIRPLKNCLPPEEHFVNISYKDKTGKKDDITFCWYIMDEDGARKTRGASNSKKKTVQGALGVDVETELVTRSKRFLYFKGDSDKQQDSSEDPQSILARIVLIRNRIYEFSLIVRKDLVIFGYFRTYSFDVENPDFFKTDFLEKIKPSLQDPKVKGLIIDVRGNGGGHIPAAERLLRVFASKEKVKLEQFQFISTPLTLQLCRNPENRDLDLEKFAHSIECAIQTGDTYSQGFTLTDEIPTKENGKYDGPVVLITDALCYSATDIFAAGFKDNHVGTILGVHENTGAGGANVWNYEFLRKRLKNGELKENPGGKNCDWDFRVAIRRATRVGDKRDMPLEDLGVKPDCFHHMTRDDLLKKNKDLIVKAMDILTGCKECKEEPKRCQKNSISRSRTDS
jgi:hypothetical protein